VGFDRDQALPRHGAELTRMVADLQLFAAMCHETAIQLLFPEFNPCSDTKTLTPRELEVLRWTMESKTAWEVSRILNISEQTAVRHISNATHKLG